MTQLLNNLVASINYLEEEYYMRLKPLKKIRCDHKYPDGNWAVAFDLT